MMMRHIGKALLALAAGAVLIGGAHAACIDGTALSKAGNMTAGGGLAAVFDNDENTAGHNPATSGFVWLGLASPTKIDRIEVISTTNGFDASGSTTAITLTARGKVGSAAPTGSPTSHTNLGGVAFTDINARTVKTISATNKTTAFDWVGINMTTGVWSSIAEICVYPVVEVTPTPPQWPDVLPPAGTTEERLEALENKFARGFWYANTGDNAEQVSSLPLTTAQPFQFRVIYSIPAPEIFAGDLVRFTAMYEVTNPYTYNVMSARYTVIADSPTATTGIPLSEAAGQNVTPGTHHMLMPDYGGWVADQTLTGKYINIVGYAASSAATSGTALIVEPGYGRAELMITPGPLLAQ